MYSILRTAKIKSRQQITSAAEHNFRIRNQGNIDATKSNQNQILVNTLNVDTTKSNDLQLKLTEYYNDLGIKEKKENVLMLEYVCSASPEFFNGKSKKEIKEWASTQVDFFKAEFGDNLKLGVLHLDEKTPHIHFKVSTEIKSIKKYRNQKGEFFKENYSLNAKRWNPDFLRGLHDRYAITNQKYGLKRGEKNSDKVHQPVKDYYQELNDKQHQLNEELRQIETLKRFKEAYPMMKKTILSSYASIMELFDILEKKDLSESEIEVMNNIANKMPSSTKKPRKTS